ncbi:MULTISPECIES: ABC transporter substrate-binding protein [unclassified Variovorax]|uniref:ABC transporter substrate-binding protein n=1 Tax=unclassified Variovorax TaxID=663243 RepID=UPI0002713E6A|nr:MULTISPECIES: ABC transporter substrate-binding protein [unclassified Variovorax]EJL75575.1 ABC-type branched-chain amino acid transport system, periplasmic component [Variovorax sp. CF313]KQX19871.1 ABC transporter permease [Variovorax sp. Root434]
MQHRFRLAASAAILLACAAAAAQGTPNTISDDVVRIGVMADQTGPYSGNGGPGSSLAVKMAVEDFGGKVLGKPVEVLVADDQNKPDVGLNIARKWLDTEKVDTIVGGSASSIALGVSSLLKERKKPYLIAGTVSAELTNKSCSPMNFQFLTDTYALPKAGVQSLMKQGVKSFYFITVDYAFGQAFQDDATKFIQAAGGKVVGSVKHPLGATDFSSYLLQAQSSGAQAIVILNAGLDLSNALKQAAEYKLTRNGQMVSVFGMTINSVSAMGLDVAQGLQLTVPFYWDRDDASREWSKRFMARNKGVVPTYIHAGAYSATMHYLNAVKAAGTDDGATVAAKMKATPINDFFSKDIKIREDGQALRPVYAVQVKKPAESKGANDYYAVRAEIPPEQTWRPLAESSCDFIKGK